MMCRYKGMKMDPDVYQYITNGRQSLHDQKWKLKANFENTNENN